MSYGPVLPVRSTALALTLLCGMLALTSAPGATQSLAPSVGTVTASPRPVATSVPGAAPRAISAPSPKVTAPAQSSTPTATASPAPAALQATPAAPIFASFTGRLLDLQSGFVFFASGDAFRLAPDAVRTDVAHKSPFVGDDVTGLYGKADFSADGIIRALQIDNHAFPEIAGNPSVAKFAVATSQKVENPELADDGNGFTGAPVLVSFTVTVPPATPLTGYIYMTTEGSRWNPMEIRMDRVDALHYRLTRSIASGTKLVYRYTRGTWRSSERGRDGLEGPPRRYTVQNLDVARRDDIIYHWSDENVTGAPPLSPDGVPTPFNGQPFSKQS